MRIATVVGARPQFVKAATLSQGLRSRHEELLIHTGQHYDFEMSQIFFQDLPLPEPDYNLEVGSGSHAYQAGHSILRLEPILIAEEPDMVLTYGDTNATLAAAIAAAKLNLPIAHIEAGIRHHDRTVPEEVNRLITDHLSALLFCPTETSVIALRREGIESGVHLVGDVLLDSTQANAKIAATRSSILRELGMDPGRYYLATVHRPVNTDDPTRLWEIFAGLGMLDMPVVIPLHPRTRSCLHDYGFWEQVDSFDKLVMTQPLGYLDFLKLEQNAALIATDSGGVQREAYFLGIPCVTLQTQCPWPETVEDGWNKLVTPDRKTLVDVITSFRPPETIGTAFGDGTTTQQIVEIIGDYP